MEFVEMKEKVADDGRMRRLAREIWDSYRWGASSGSSKTASYRCLRVRRRLLLLALSAEQLQPLQTAKMNLRALAR